MQIQPVTASIVFCTSLLLGSLLFVLLTWVNQNQKHSSRLLGLFFLLLTIFSVHDLLLYTGVMLEVPFLFRLPRAASCLTGVLIFLYIRSVLYGELRFRRTDWLHLLPSAVFFIDLLPFYFVGKEERLQQVRSFLEHVDIATVHAQGWLPAWVGHVFMPLTILTYASAAGRLLYRAVRHDGDFILRQNQVMRNWLILLWSVFTFLAVLWSVVILFRNALPNHGTLLIQSLIAGLLTVFTGASLLFFPNILYGFQGHMPLVEQEDVSQTGQDRTVDGEAEAGSQGLVLTEERRQAYMQRLEAVMEHEKPFLKPGFSKPDLAAATAIPYYYLSVVINQQYGWNYNEFVNKYRVDYVKHLLDQPDSGKYSLEGLATMAGFGSRITFARAFQKFVGCTPGEYLKRRKAGGFIEE